MSQCTPAHEGERCDFDNACGDGTLNLISRHHVVKRVIERSQIRVDLLSHVAGKKTKPLTSFDGWAGKDDAVHQTTLQQHRRMGDRQIGLTRTCWPYAEHHFR